MTADKDQNQPAVCNEGSSPHCNDHIQIDETTCKLPPGHSSELNENNNVPKINGERNSLKVGRIRQKVQIKYHLDSTEANNCDILDLMNNQPKAKDHGNFI